MSTHQLKVFVDEFGNDAEAGELATVKELPDLVLLAKSVLSIVKHHRLLTISCLSDGCIHEFETYSQNLLEEPNITCLRIFVTTHFHLM